MGFKTEYIVDSTGNFSKTYDEIRIRTEEDDSDDRVIRLEQGNDTILISGDQIKDFMDILIILNKP